jgi:sugar lactone lactonase YvrE
LNYELISLFSSHIFVVKDTQQQKIMKPNFSIVNSLKQKSLVANLAIGSVGAIAISALSCSTATAVIFVSDRGTNSIYTISSTGVRNTFATGLNNPAGLAVDRNGNLFASDANSNTIYKFDPNGVRSTFTTDNLSFPVALAFAPSGNLFVGNLNSSTIDVFTPDGLFLENFASGINAPLALAFDASGTLYDAQTDNADPALGTINTFTPDGQQSRVFSSLGYYPFGLVFDANGNLLVSNTGGTTIDLVDPNNGFILDTYTTVFNAPAGLVFDADGDFFVADSGSGNVYEFAPDGSVRSTFSGFDQPFALAFAPDAPTPTAVPEPFTVIGTLIGGTAALRMRKRLKVTNKL